MGSGSCEAVTRAVFPGVARGGGSAESSIEETRKILYTPRLTKGGKDPAGSADSSPEASPSQCSRPASSGVSSMRERSVCQGGGTCTKRDSAWGGGSGMDS